MLKFSKKKKGIKANYKDPNLIELENSLSSKTGLNIMIKNSKRNKGTLSVEFKDLDQLNRLIEIIKNNY